MNEQIRICHDCHSFKWWNINIYLILTSFVYGLTPFWHVGLWLHLFWKWNSFKFLVKTNSFDQKFQIISHWIRYSNYIFSMWSQNV